jgi:protoporphyrinogen oxidase
MKEEQFGYLPGGYARMLETYERTLCRLGVVIHLKAEVQEIRLSPEAGLDVRLRSGESHHFSRVIVTTPPGVTDHLCVDLTDEERYSLRQIPYLGIICASALLRRPLSQFYITNILDETLPVTGLIEMTALVDPAEFGERYLVYIPHYIRPDHPDFMRSDSDLCAEVTSSLKRMHPTLKDEDFVAVRISRSRYVFPRPTPNSFRHVPAIDTSVPGLSIVNSAHILNGTLNANETIGLAQREARRIHALFN